MAKSVMTVSDVNQDFSKAQRAVGNGPVVITHRGEPSLVLMSYKDYQSSKGKSLLDRLNVPEVEDIDVEFPRLNDTSVKPARFD
jgi:prevent-host-death family protein